MLALSRFYAVHTSDRGHRSDVACDEDRRKTGNDVKRTCKTFIAGAVSNRRICLSSFLFSG